MKNRGIFITLEGGEGAGKTSQMKKIEKYFNDKNIPYICTREPGGIGISEEIRSIILDKKNTLMDQRTEALLYAASRRQHLVERVIPALSDGKVVICDRFLDSSLAYQGFARGIGIDTVFSINKFAIDDCMPDLTIFLDIEPKEGLKRVKRRNGEINRIDLESLEFHNKVREGYLKLINMYPLRIKRVNASYSEQEVFRNISLLLDEVLIKKRVYNK